MTDPGHTKQTEIAYLNTALSEPFKTVIQGS